MVFGLVGFGCMWLGVWFVGFVVGVVGCLYFDETWKLDMIVCCLTFERSDGCLYFFALMLGFCLLSSSAALSKAAIIVGFRFGSSIVVLFRVSVTILKTLGGTTLCDGAGVVHAFDNVLNGWQRRGARVLAHGKEGGRRPFP